MGEFVGVGWGCVAQSMGEEQGRHEAFGGELVEVVGVDSAKMPDVHKLGEAQDVPLLEGVWGLLENGVEGGQPIAEDTCCLGTLGSQHHLHVLGLDGLLAGGLRVGLVAYGLHGGLYGMKQGGGVGLGWPRRGGGGRASFALGGWQLVGGVGGVEA